LQKKLGKKRTPPPLCLHRQGNFLDSASANKHAESASAESKLRFLSTFASYSRTLLIAIVVGLLRNTTVCLQNRNCQLNK